MQATKGITDSAIIEKAKMSTRTFYKAKSGEPVRPTTAYKIAHAIGIDYTEIFKAV